MSLNVVVRVSSPDQFPAMVKRFRTRCQRAGVLKQIARNQFYRSKSERKNDKRLRHRQASNRNKRKHRDPKPYKL